MHIIRRERVRNKELTFGRIEVPSVNHSWADAHEKNSILGMLSVELRNDDIRGGLSKGVRSGHINLVFSDQVKVCMSRGNEHNLLLRSFEDQWQEQVEQINCPDDIGLDTCKDLLFESDRIFSPKFLLTSKGN